MLICSYLIYELVPEKLTSEKVLEMEQELVAEEEAREKKTAGEEKENSQCKV